MHLFPELEDAQVGCSGALGTIGAGGDINKLSGRGGDGETGECDDVCDGGSLIFSKADGIKTSVIHFAAGNRFLLSVLDRDAEGQILFVAGGRDRQMFRQDFREKGDLAFGQQGFILVQGLKRQRLAFARELRELKGSLKPSFPGAVQGDPVPVI